MTTFAFLWRNCRPNECCPQLVFQAEVVEFLRRSKNRGAIVGAIYRAIVTPEVSLIRCEQAPCQDIFELHVREGIKILLRSRDGTKVFVEQVGIAGLLSELEDEPDDSGS